MRSTIAIVLVCVTLTGCSVRLAYNNADRLAVWQAGEYIDLERAQKTWLRARMRMFMHWHRRHQLPEWAEALRDLDLAVQDDVRGEDLDGLYARAEGWYDEILTQLQPTAVDLLLTLSDAQIDALPANFERRNEELNEDYAGLSPEAARAVWQDEMREAVDQWIGDLTPTQELLLASASTEVVPDNAAWIGYRERWQAGLMEALARRDEPGHLQAAFAALVREREAYYTPEYAEVRERNDAVYRSFTLRLLESLDERQRRKLSERLADLAEDFDALAAQDVTVPEDPGPPPGA